MIEVEYRPASEETCECCGGVATSLTRFVLKDGDAFAVVYLKISNSHPDRVVRAAVSAGMWWDGTGPSDRTSFALELWSGTDDYVVTVCDAETSPWREVGLIGTMLNRADALEHPLINEVFHITDHLFREDPVLKPYLDEMPTA